MTVNPSALPGDEDAAKDYQARREQVWQFLDDYVSDPHLWIAAESLLLGGPHTTPEQDIEIAVAHLDHVRRTRPEPSGRLPGAGETDAAL